MVLVVRRQSRDKQTGEVTERRREYDGPLGGLVNRILRRPSAEEEVVYRPTQHER